jgi:hypothetical protein
MFASLLLGLTLSVQARPAQADGGDTAALVVGARTITVFRASYGPTSVAERAVDPLRARRAPRLLPGAGEGPGQVTGSSGARSGYRPVASGPMLVP